MQKCIWLTGGGRSKYCRVAPFMSKHTNGSLETLSEGASVVPIIGMSDQTNLSNFCGEKKAWPVYMTIGNLPLTIRNRPESREILLLGLFPIAPKLAKSSMADKLQKPINADTLLAVFELIFGPLNSVVRDVVLCTSQADSSQTRAEPGSSPASPGVPQARPARVSWQPVSCRLEQGSMSGLESLGGSSRLGQGSTSRLDSRLEPLRGFLAARV